MPLLCSEDRRTLLAIAREAILEAVLHKRASDFKVPTQSASGALAEPRGAFVTLYLRRHLRGCIGRAETSDRLVETVAQSAISAALYDPRFTPVASNEVSELAIEISVLSPLSPISAEAIEAGKHGVLVSCADRRALLLPQVATERRWSANRFLAETCRKAGLDSEAWRNPQTQLFGFTVEVFSDSDVQKAYSSST